METLRPRLSLMAVATYHSAIDTIHGVAAGVAAEAVWSLEVLHASMTSRISTAA